MLTVPFMELCTVEVFHPPALLITYRLCKFLPFLGLHEFLEQIKA